MVDEFEEFSVPHERELFDDAFDVFQFLLQKCGFEFFLVEVSAFFVNSPDVFCRSSVEVYGQRLECGGVDFALPSGVEFAVHASFSPPRLCPCI